MIEYLIVSPIVYLIAYILIFKKTGYKITVGDLILFSVIAVIPLLNIAVILISLHELLKDSGILDKELF